MEKMIQKIVWSMTKKAFANGINVDFNELMAEANLAYLEALRTHDESKGKVSTHIWNCISGHLKNFIREEMKHSHIPIDEIEKGENASAYFEKLSSDAQDIARIVINAPDELFCMAQEDAQVKIVQELLNKGWCWAKIHKGFKNLSQIYG